MEEEAPIVYKFREFDNEYHRRILTDSEIWFASPGQFNDPFDCNIRFKLEESPDEWLLSAMTEFALSRNPELSGKEAKKQAERELRETGGKKHRQELRDYQFCQVSQKTGIFSLTPHWDTQAANLMWSHYSDSHKGFAVGFDMNVLLSWMRDVSGADASSVRKGPSEGLEVRPAQANYVEAMPQLIPGKHRERDIIGVLLTYKSHVWKYEDERRLLMMKLDADGSFTKLSDNNRTQALPENALSEVILGVNASEEDLEEVKEILSDRKNSPELYKAQLTENRYALKRKKISY